MSDLADHAALAEAFAPCTITGLADELWRMNLEIHDLRKQRDAIEQILLAHCKKTGEVIEGKTAPPLRAVDYIASIDYMGRPIWSWKLEFDRKR